MAAIHPTPRNREAPFGIEELFFSTTDTKGRIRSGNAVFTRTAGYTREEMVGQPHNLIRHPDMPRVVFRLLWEHLDRGEPFAGYVKNLAKDGSFYWVMALVVPTDEGHLSVRLKPTTSSFAAIEELYRQLRSIEDEIESSAERGAKRAAMDASEGGLQDRLGDLGFDDYRGFMRSALSAEVAAREAVLHTDRAQSRLAGVGSGALRAALEACETVSTWLSELVGDLARYRALQEAMSQRSASLGGLADSSRVFALNATLAAGRLGPEGAALNEVASLLRQSFDALDGRINDLTEVITPTVGLLADLDAQVAASKLQTEMAAVFLYEMVAAGPTEDAIADLAVLTGALSGSVSELLRTLESLASHVRAIGQRSAGIVRQLEAVGALEVNGRIEAARLHDDGGVAELLLTIRDRVGTAREQLRRADADGDVVIRRDALAVVGDELARIRRAVADLCDGSRDDAGVTLSAPSG